MPSEYTVVGLIVEDSGELLVREVAPSSPHYRPWTLTLEAGTAEQAQTIATLVYCTEGAALTVTAGQVAGGDYLVYRDGQSAQIAETRTSEDRDVVVVFVEPVDDDHAVYDPSAMLHIVRTGTTDNEFHNS